MRNAYFHRLKQLFPDTKVVEAYLIKNSKLPGRSCNSELAIEFADVMTEVADQTSWLVKLATMDEFEAPMNNPKEFLPYAATVALGGLYTLKDADVQEQIFEIIRINSHSPRSRTRTAASLALSRIGCGDFDIFIALLEDWLQTASLSDWKTIASSLVHEELYQEESDVRLEATFDILRRVFAAYSKLTSDGKKTSEGKTLSTTLGVVPSMLTVINPRMGFRFLKNIADTEDIAVKKIVAANIRKSRLAKKYREECMEVGEILSWG